MYKIKLSLGKTKLSISKDRRNNITFGVQSKFGKRKSISFSSTFKQGSASTNFQKLGSLASSVKSKFRRKPKDKPFLYDGLPDGLNIA